MKTFLCAVFSLHVLTGAMAFASDPQPTIDFNRDIRPILYNKCVICHGPDEAQRPTELRLDVPPALGQGPERGNRP